MSSLTLSLSSNRVGHHGSEASILPNSSGGDPRINSSIASQEALLQALRSADLSDLERSLVMGDPVPQSLEQATALEASMPAHDHFGIRQADRHDASVATRRPSPTQLDETRAGLVAAATRSLDDLIEGHEDLLTNLVESLVGAYVAVEQNPASGSFDRGGFNRPRSPSHETDLSVIRPYQRVEKAYKSLTEALRLAGPNFDREFSVLKAEILSRVMQGLRAEYRESSNNLSQTPVNRQIVQTLPTAAQLEDMLFGTTGAADAARAPLFSLVFDVNKASEQRKLDKRDHASADFTTPQAAERALKTAFATSSAMYLQAQALQAAGTPFLTSLDKPDANRSRALVAVLDQYVSSCEARALNGEPVEVAVLAQIKGLLDKSWDPTFGGVGRFSPSDPADKLSKDDFFTRFDLSADVRGNRRAISALRASIEYYNKALSEYEVQSARDPLLADLRSVQVHSMVGQLINDLLLNPGLSKPPQSEELMRFFSGFSEQLLSKDLDIAKIASLQRSMRSSPLFMELPLENITSPVAQAIAHCLGGGDKREAVRANLIQEALHLSPGSKRDLWTGLRGRFRDIERGAALEITGRYQKPDSIMGLPDEGLDPQAGELASELCDQAGVGIRDNKRLLDNLTSPAYGAGERPVTVLRDRTLPMQLEALVNTERFDGLKGHDAGAKRAWLLAGQLGKLADETKQSLDRLDLEKSKLLADARLLAGEDFSAKDFDALCRDHNHEARERLGPRIIELALSYDRAFKSADALRAKLSEIESLRAIVLPASFAPMAQGDPLQRGNALPRGVRPAFDDHRMPEAQALRHALGHLDFRPTKALDQQGRIHELGSLGGRETVAGLIHRSGQRTYCSISGTTADLVLALYAQLGPHKLSPLLDSILTASESPQADQWSGLSADAKALATVVSVFMQRGGYHTPAEVLGGLLVAAASMKQIPDRDDAQRMATRYETLLNRLSADPAAFFIIKDDQANAFRKHIDTKTERLLDLSRGNQNHSSDALAAPALNAGAQALGAVVLQPNTLSPQSIAARPETLAQASSAFADQVADDVGRYPQVLGFEDARNRERMRAEAAATSFALKAEALRHKLTLATDAMNLPITIIDGLWDIRDNAMQLATGLADDPFDDFVDSIAGLAEADVAISALTTTLSITRYAISLKKAAQVKHSLIESLNAAEVKLGQSKDLGKLIERLIEKRAKLNDLIPSDVAEAARKREALKDLNTSLERLQQAYARLQLLEPGLRQKIQTLRYKLDEAELKKMRFAAGVAYKGLKASHDVAKLAGGVGTTVAAAINPISIVFMPAALISFGTSTKRAFDSTRDAIRINKDIKSVDQQLLSLRNAVAEAFKPPLTSDKAIDKAIEARPSERAMMRMLLASKDQLKREHKLSATTAVAESFGAVSSALSVASSTLSILGIAGAPASLGVSLGITAAGLLIGGLAAGINVGLWLYKRHAAKQKQDSLHDAQTGLESLKAGGNLDYIAELNPFIAKARRAAMAELKRSSGDINADALGQKVQAKCEAFIRARHVNQHASTVTTLMTRELNEMGQFVYQCVTNPALRERLAQALSPEEQALLKTLINDRPRGQEGSIPPPNPSDKALQRRYLALVANMLALSRQAEAGANGARAGQAQNLTQGTESATNLLMQRFPICSVLALKEESKLAVDGSLALSDMYYAGGHRASSEALMIQMGLAPLAVEDRAAGDYFSPVPQGPLREAAATGLVNLGPQESASSVVSMALRSDPELAKLVLEPHGLADVAPSSMQTSEAENQKLRSSLMEQAGAESAPGQLLARLLGPDRSGTMLLSVDRSNAPLTSRASAGRAILGEGEGRAFSNLVQSYLANREGLAAQRQFLISVDLERSKKDKRSLSIPIRPDLQSMAPDGSARQMDFIACNRSRDRLRPEYVTYEKLGDSWFVRTTEKLARIEMNPEIIEAKIKDVATPYEEKLLYLQVRNDLHENACLVKYSKI